MKYKIFIALFSIFILSSCDTYVKTNKISPNIIEDKYKNTGFALIFNKDLMKFQRSRSTLLEILKLSDK